jgi:hypothetical protein
MFLQLWSWSVSNQALTNRQCTHGTRLVSGTALAGCAQSTQRTLDHRKRKGCIAKLPERKLDPARCRLRSCSGRPPPVQPRLNRLQVAPPLSIATTHLRGPLSRSARSGRVRFVASAHWHQTCQAACCHPAAGQRKSVPPGAPLACALSSCHGRPTVLLAPAQARSARPIPLTRRLTECQRLGVRGPTGLPPGPPKVAPQHKQRGRPFGQWSHSRPPPEPHAPFACAWH